MRERLWGFDHRRRRTAWRAGGRGCLGGCAVVHHHLCGELWRDRLAVGAIQRSEDFVRTAAAGNHPGVMVKTSDVF